MVNRFFRALRAALFSGVAYIRHLSRRTVIIIGALVLVVIGMFIFVGGGQDEAAQTNNTRGVEVRSVLSLSSESSSLSISGTVTSRSEATVRAEKSGEIKRLNYELGSSVGAGGIVAEIENASERAAVLQAEAGVEAARASASVSGSGLEAARSKAVTALLSAYAATENALEGTTDRLFLKPSGFPKIYTMRVHSNNETAQNNAEKMRVAADSVLLRQQKMSESLTDTTNLRAELEITEVEVREVRNLLNSLIEALNEGKTDSAISADDLASYRSDVIAAREDITATLAEITTAKQTLQSAEANSSGGSSASAAALKQAEAGLASARADFEHTVVRAPISGTINSLSLKRGDYVQSGTAVLTVGNNNALEVLAYVTEGDAREIEVGSKAVVRGDIEGTVTRIAPAIDPLTKKIEMRIGLPAQTSTDPKKMLLNGQSVTIELTHDTTSTTAPSKLVIPLSAVKIGVDEMVVYTVADDSTLVAHPVILGTLMGDRVEITEGLTADMRIVVDARGLRPGETVTIR